MILENYFKSAIDNGASDVHLIEGSVPTLRVTNEIVKLNEKPLQKDELKNAIYPLLSEQERNKLERNKDLDISLNFFGNNFRVNVHYQEGLLGLSARLIPATVPSPEDIRLEKAVYKLSKLHDGLILVTGPAGVGKSTTLAVIIDMINKERKSHIITIEDPIEYLYNDKQSIVEQRQLGRDTNSFASALKYALRQDPNVIMVGEMRDLETINAAISAAKSGHLVLSTLHTSTAAETVERIVDFFPPNDHQQVADELSLVLRAVIAQMLLPGTGGGLVAAREIMINNKAISNLIKRGQTEQINSVIMTNLKEGMITMNSSINNLLKDGLITEETAGKYRRDLETNAIYT